MKSFVPKFFFGLINRSAGAQSDLIRKKMPETKYSNAFNWTLYIFVGRVVVVA
jgi:hypothetical protein